MPPQYASNMRPGIGELNDHPPSTPDRCCYGTEVFSCWCGPRQRGKRTSMTVGQKWSFASFRLGSSASHTRNLWHAFFEDNWNWWESSKIMVWFLRTNPPQFACSRYKPPPHASQISLKKCGVVSFTFDVCVNPFGNPYRNLLKTIFFPQPSVQRSVGVSSVEKKHDAPRHRHRGPRTGGGLINLSLDITFSQWLGCWFP